MEQEPGQAVHVGPLVHEGKGWCFLCGEEIEDADAHQMEKHPVPDE